MEEEEEAIAVEIVIKNKKITTHVIYIKWSREKKGYGTNNSVFLPAQSQSALQIIYPFELQPPLGRAK